ncbi:C-GCAxxG-C-C family protein [Bilophila wadsworthia]|uniref:C-GCAxxG-C-C family protein n=1 Tax=Bilophila wadsworthia TaxID=35833 RepID=UPI0009DC0035
MSSETPQNGFCFRTRMGGARCCCGALIGGEMAVGFLFGRTEENGFCPDVCGHVAKQLYDRFVEHNLVTCCRVLHKGLPYGTPEQFEACAKRAVEATRIAAEVILRQ